MRQPAVAALVLAVVCAAGRAAAQDPAPKIGPFVVDLRGSIPKFPDEDQMAESRGLSVAELPGRGLGFDAAAHVYLPKWKAVTFGLGGQFTISRSHRDGSTENGTRATTGVFTAFAPQLSLNFGDGEGWSYLSGGIGVSSLALYADSVGSVPADDARIRTINYGGGARWFARRRIGFHFDVRFFDIDPGPPNGALPGTPRSRFTEISVGVSLKPWRP
jgi:hypothetical protein